jgi:hypothetical protein
MMDAGQNVILKMLIWVGLRGLLQGELYIYVYLFIPVMI